MPAMPPNVTLKQLRAFLTVTQERSFTRAARRLNLSQSALTLSVRALEAAVGIQLIDRTTRSVAATSQGARFIPIAERLLEEVQHALQDLQAHAERQRGLAVIAATASLLTQVIAPALRHLSERYPGIAVRVFDDSTIGATRRLMSEEVDFAIMTMARTNPDVEALPLLRDRFGVLCPAGHAMAGQAGPLPWAALASLPMVALSLQNGIRAELERHAASAPVLARPRYETSSLSGLCSFVEHGLGVAAVPALVGRSVSSATLAFRPLEPALHRTVYLARLPGRSPTPAAAEVATVIVEHLARLRSEEVEVLADRATLAAAGYHSRSPALGG